MSTPSGNSNNNNAHNSFEMNPPVLMDGHSKSKYDSNIWETFTLLEKEKQGLAVFLSMTGQDKQAVGTLSKENLSLVNGVKPIIDKLHKLFLNDESSLAYEAYEKFEKFSRPDDMCISDYGIKLEQLCQITKSHKMEILDEVLAYRLFNNASLSEEKKLLILATVIEMKCKIMKEQLKKVFMSLSFEKCSREEAVKLDQSDLFSQDFAKREHNENDFYSKSAVENTQ